MGDGRFVVDWELMLPAKVVVVDDAGLVTMFLQVPPAADEAKDKG